MLARADRHGDALSLRDDGPSCRGPRLADRGGMQEPMPSDHPCAPDPFARREMVLVVDDEPAAGELIHQAIAGGGLDSFVAWSTAEALVLARRYPIAVLVTGVQLRSMTGLELAAQIRDLHAGVPVILVAEDEEASAVAIEPPAAILGKPFSLRDVNDAVSALRSGLANKPIARADHPALEDVAGLSGRPADRRSMAPDAVDVRDFTT
jgi:DNA-binding response OmpR family regulator